ncbi:MAG: TonB-dependent receptor [Gammaproteobacteria bacterium]
MNKKLLVCFFLSSPVVAGTVADENEPPELEAVVVSMPLEKTGSTSARPVTVLSGEALRTKIGQTIGETLKNEPGVTSQSFGPGVGSPVIRGQSGPRVRVMQNSLGNNDVSSLSPDHANGVEPILAERIEVLRGPSTLLYGSGAIGGVVNVIDNRIPERMPDRLLGGAGEQRYDSATNESASAIKLEGGKNGLAFHVDGFYRDQNNTHIGGRPIDEEALRSIDSGFDGAANNPDGLIDHSQARSRGGSAGLSMIGEGGMAGVSINRLEKLYGIPSDGSGGDPVTVDLAQTKYDFKGLLNKPAPFADKLRLKFGYTDYQHVELDGGAPATTFLNQSYESRLELEHKPIGPVKGVVGFQSVNSEFAALGEEALVPESESDSFGLFAVESLSTGPLTYELGVRGEWQDITPENGNTLTYKPISGSASVLWDVTPRHQVSLAVTHSQRAPQIQELFSNGVHEATRSFELGNANLDKELSNNLDLGYRFKGDRMSAEINLFHNWVADYIYQHRTGEVFDEDSEDFASVCPAGGSCLPVFESRQADAIFRGFEAKTAVILMENHYGVIDLTLFGDYTRGSFNSGADVPRMPPLRYGFQLGYDRDEWSTNVRLTRGEAQTDAGDNESATGGYLLLDLGAQYRLAGFEESEILLFAKAKNLLNENIRNSTSYLRNFAPEPGRSAEIGIRISY